MMKAKRMIGVLLAICLMLGVMPAAAANAATMEAPADETKDFGANANTADAATIYFGGKVWRVIGYDGTGVVSENGTMTLLSEDLVTFIKYDYSFAKSNVYSTSAVKTTINSEFLEKFKRNVRFLFCSL